MDPLTHAASGALLALSCERPRSLWAVPLAALVSASPDVDIFFSPSPVDYLLLHRGITHALVAVPVLGLLAALLLHVYWRKKGGVWTFGKTWLLGMGLIALHIWLDCVTTYGTMIFLPFSEYRVRLNGVFIIDFLLLLPMLAGLYFACKKKAVALALMAWIVVYPSACVALRMTHEATVAACLQAQGVQARQLTLLPDALAPLYWRVIYETDTPFTPADNAAPGFAHTSTPTSVHQQGLDWRGQPMTETRRYPAAERELTENLRQASARAAVFFNFTLMPLQEYVPPSLISGAEPTWRFYDLRFGTMLPWVEELMDKRRNGGIPFLLEARRRAERWTWVRMEFSGANRNSPWEEPQAARPLTWWEWALGLR